METPLIVAKILGVYLVVSGLFLIIRGKTVPSLMRDFFNHPAIVYLAGVILIFLSTLFLLEHNIWDGTWRSVVTLFAWATFVKGLLYILAPRMLEQMVTKKMFGALNLWGVIAIIAGLSLFCVA
jgi:hypothetical protein